ncbi:MAG: ribosomal protein methylthiotransferase [Frankiaceae bacterium]|nr:ribosomal protein methylthiotransferase [Frankiaceae bacterium]MDQ1671700.1 ribosomal protein methylthiotransferase [Frankiaceae bacterium]
MPSSRRAALVTLGCARNEVDSEELAARLERDGWTLVDDPEDADAVVVNTCGFVEAAKKDSVDTVLALADGASSDPHGPSRAVVAVGCLAERYGTELATALPEADAVLGFDAYPQLGAHLDAILAGETPASHTPRDRRTLLPLSPVARRSSTAAVPGHGEALRVVTPPADLPAGLAPASGPPVLRRRLSGGPVAPLKIASGCDRRCSFCAIPSFRGSYVSRLPDEILAEAEMLAADGVREIVLVSENSTSYGKDFGDLRALEKLLPQLAAVDGIARIRPVYLQPAEVRPSLLEALLTTPGVSPYLDLSFQHASATVLRRMRRFGDRPRFLDLLASARAMAPELGARSNVIVGFPGETEEELAELERFLESARLDVVGVFGYSDEDGTEATSLPGQIEPDEVARRVARVTDLVEQLTAARAEERVGQFVDVLVESALDGDEWASADVIVEGRAAHQAPEIDGSCTVAAPAGTELAVGDIVRARVLAGEGVDLVTEFVSVIDSGRTDPARTASGVGAR